MPIDPKQALGRELGEGKYSYTRDQVILYHLGVGAGDQVVEDQIGRAHV